MVPRSPAADARLGGGNPDGRRGGSAALPFVYACTGAPAPPRLHILCAAS